MVSLHYTHKHKSEYHLPHSRAFESLTKHTRRHSHPKTSQQTSCHIQDLRTQPETPDLNTYSSNMRTWTLNLFHTAFPTAPHRLSKHQYSYTTSTIVSPLYPKDSLLYSINTPRSVDVEEEEVLKDIGTTPCNTPKNRGLRRRSTVVAAKGGRVREEIADEGAEQARLRPMELTRSLSCAG